MFSKERKAYHQRVLSEIAQMRGGVSATQEIEQTPAEVRRENKDDAWAATKIAELLNPPMRFI